MTNKRIKKKQFKRWIENNAYLHTAKGIMTSGSLNYPRRRQLEKTFKDGHLGVRVGYTIEQAQEQPKSYVIDYNIGFTDVIFTLDGKEL